MISVPRRDPECQVLIKSDRAVSHAPSMPWPSPTQNTSELASQRRSTIIKKKCYNQ